MTAKELVEHDLYKIQVNIQKARAKPNAPQEELERLEELLALRLQIADIVHRYTEVVRCADCVFSHKDEYGETIGKQLCVKDDYYKTADHFCGYGKRRIK